MTAAIDDLIDDVIRREGGFVDHPADRGGPTKYGITRRALSRYLERAATLEEVRDLSRDLAAEIYRRDYYAAPRIDTLPEGIQAFVFDSAVNHGPRRAVRFLQEVCNAAGFGPLDVDGICGPNTRGVVAEADRVMGDRLLAALVEERRNFYRLLAAEDPSQEVFLDGWMKRVAEFDPVEKAVA